MKKYLLLVATLSTFVMCKKGEATQSQFEKTGNPADSITSVAPETINSVNYAASQKPYNFLG